ncbi:hypothetical protein NQ176_g10518 [Zarea fungicola]|uniref:Uncharacterized protein n=1 Tax=Zarea fungicola TaxID=93591 RepID=A0ACC1MG32_9HYPO|nr:hypothetical protein NQ176_g10518 [Lecanicillium fungicola]
MESTQHQDYGQAWQHQFAEFLTRNAENQQQERAESNARLHQANARADYQQYVAEQLRKQVETQKVEILRLEYDKRTLSNIMIHQQREKIAQQRCVEQHLHGQKAQAMYAGGEQGFAPVPSLIHNEPPIQEQPVRGVATPQQL